MKINHRLKNPYSKRNWAYGTITTDSGTVLAHLTDIAQPIPDTEDNYKWVAPARTPDGKFAQAYWTYEPNDCNENADIENYYDEDKIDGVVYLPHNFRLTNLQISDII